MARKKHGPPHEEHQGEAWLLPYSDLMTLLLALFISLFAISQTDQTKVSQMAQAFSSAFNMGGPSFFSQMGPNAGRMAEMPSDEDRGNSAYIQESKQLDEVKREIDEYVKQNDLEQDLSTTMTDDGLMIRIKENALFPSGSATLGGQAQRIGPVVANLLAPMTQRVIISGHTDNVPINTPQFPSNWELSSQRAINFMKYLFSLNSKLNPVRFSAIGFAEYRPIADNATEEGRQKNRRVEILIARSTQFNPDEGMKNAQGNSTGSIGGSGQTGIPTQMGGAAVVTPPSTPKSSGQ